MMLYGDCALLAFASLIVGFVLAVFISDSVHKYKLRTEGTSSIGPRYRIIGHVEQKVDGFKDRWEKVGGE